MKPIRPTTALIIFTAILALTGCADLKVLEPKADVSRFYYLKGQPGETEAQNDLIVMIGSSSLADYLDQPQIVTFDEPNRVRYSNVHRWAEPLDSAINRLLSDGISAGLGTPRVGGQGVMAGQAWNYRLGYRIDQLGGSLNGEVRLQVAWWLDSDAGESREFVRSTYTQTIDAKSGDYAAYAQAIQSLIEQWSKDIVARIKAAAPDQS